LLLGCEYTRLVAGELDLLIDELDRLGVLLL
jgi:hypothetical protein